jgi:hypothetical protein
MSYSVIYDEKIKEKVGSNFEVKRRKRKSSHAPKGGPTTKTNWQTHHLP